MFSSFLVAGLKGLVSILGGAAFAAAIADNWRFKKHIPAMPDQNIKRAIVIWREPTGRAVICMVLHKYSQFTSMRT
jgi:hypothetical protein